MRPTQRNLLVDTGVQKQRTQNLSTLLLRLFALRHRENQFGVSEENFLDINI